MCNISASIALVSAYGFRPLSLFVQTTTLRAKHAVRTQPPSQANVILPHLHLGPQMLCCLEDKNPNPLT